MACLGCRQTLSADGVNVRLEIHGRGEGLGGAPLPCGEKGAGGIGVGVTPGAPVKTLLAPLSPA